MRRLLPFLVVFGVATTAFAAKPKITAAPTATGQVGVAFSYSFSADQTITTWGAAPLPTGLTVSATGPTTASITGTPAVGTDAGSPYTVTLSATNANGTGTATLTLTIKPAPPVITSATT